MGGTRSCSIFRQLRIAEALTRRAALFDRSDLDVFRLFHGDGEGAPGLAVDRFNDVAIIHADSPRLVADWLPLMRDEIAAVCQSAYVKVHHRDPRTAEAISAEPVWGPPRETIMVNELGAHYQVRPASGLSVGLFIDMREVRAWLRSVSRDRTVLNLFAYTCSLGVSAALGAANRVVNVDVSRPYLAWGKANYALNGLAVDEHDFIYGDAFDWLGRFARREQRFDVVIVDPPSFSSTPFAVTRDYPRLVSAAARVVSPGGVLLAATNHAATTEARFDAWLTAGLSRAPRSGQTIHRWHEPSADFPLPRGGRPYLKVHAVALN